MRKGRLEAFSDGVIAVIITIMVLELKPPHGHDLGALESLLPELVTYAVSFVLVGIYWNNHHHMLHAAEHVEGRVLWCNLHLLFWLSLIPFVTSWVAEDFSAALPTALYAAVMLLAGVSWLVLQRSLVKRNGRDSALARAVGGDVKGKMSAVFYVAAIGLAFVQTWIAHSLIVAVALMWFIPDRRIERAVHAADA
jgi:uncharacterized membrane protein